jgi:hypothetical protein
VIAIGSSRRAQETRHQRKLENGFAFHRSEWMEGGQDPRLSPTVFLVEQPPHSILNPHFHTQNQFQVVKAGCGTLGPHAVAPGSVHYAGAFTGYGPVVAGPEGLHYFTVRAVYETGANFLPADRGKLQRGPKRHAQGPAHPPLPLAALSALDGVVRIELIPDGGDGLGAFAIQLPPHAQVPVTTAGGSGMFQFVLAGELETSEAFLAEWESRYLPAGEAAQGCRAGAQGLHLLVLHMPARAADYPV